MVLTMMTLPQIDAALADWDAKLQRASDNLVALMHLTAYQRLKGEGGWPRAQVAGDTAARVLPVLEDMHDLWTYYSLFQDVVQRAKELRGSLSLLLPARGTLAEIERLLGGRSIKLPVVTTPLEQRGLLTASEVTESVTPERLLAVMNELFEQTRDAVMAVDAAWDQLPEILVRHETELSALEVLAGSLGQNAPAELTEARKRLTAMRELSDTDPLAALARCDELTPILQTARSRLEEQVKECDRVRTALVAARNLLKKLEETQRLAREICAERELKVRVDDAVLPQLADNGLVEAQGPWLAKLEATVAEGKWRAARVGLTRWTTSAEQYLAQAAAAHRASASLLHERRDLRGLLDALKAKAAACGRSEDGELAALEGEARQLLYARPTPLARARQVVAEYQQRLL
jgi:hypothetical protein